MHTIYILTCLQKYILKQKLTNKVEGKETGQVFSMTVQPIYKHHIPGKALIHRWHMISGSSFD